jgi:3-hydroxybutyrate dehydrogenase
MKLAGRVAVITGGSRGIGRGIAEAFLAEGAQVVINGRSPDKGARTLAELNAGTAAHFIAADVTQQAGVEALITDAIKHYGRVDILVNNAAGSSGYAPVVDLSDAAWNEALNLNLNSTFWATRLALRDMLTRKWGRIINISSVEGKRANKIAIAHYTTNKHAVNGFTKAVAFENGPHGITCNAICPGAVETDMMVVEGAAAAKAIGISYDELVDQYAQDAAIKRLNTVEEIAAVAVLLASEAGSGLTGALIDVNGGTAL